VWNFFEGDSLTIHVLDPREGLIERRLGLNFSKGESLQVAIEAGNWFAAEHRGSGQFTLAGCTVAPGFDYEDMEIARKDELKSRFSQHQEITERLTRA
jgi:uncharacterized protein